MSKNYGINTEQRLAPFRLAGVVERIECPFLMVHGEEDAQVSLADARAIKFAVNHIRNAGFKTVEIAPGQFKSVAGKNAFSQEDRRDLRDLLKPFRTVTVHGSGIVFHIPGGREERKEELWTPYLELMRFARDIGARLVTFHSLQPPEGPASFPGAARTSTAEPPPYTGSWKADGPADKEKFLRHLNL